jgi:predicted nuclease with TOPRIM domain
MIDLNTLTPEQREIVKEYQTIHSRLSALEDEMKDLSTEANKLMEQLKRLRKKDKNIFENYGKEKGI